MGYKRCEAIAERRGCGSSCRAIHNVNTSHRHTCGRVGYAMLTRHEAYDMETPLSHPIIPNLDPINETNEDKEFSNCNEAQAFRFHDKHPITKKKQRRVEDLWGWTPHTTFKFTRVYEGV